MSDGHDDRLGAVTSDGYWVDVYANLPEGGEEEVLRPWLGEGTSVLELGCGTGRLSRRLADAGHRVVAVDHSADMLEYLADAPGVRALHVEIEDLHLPDRFEVVLMPSYLIHVTDEALRHSFFAAAAEHLAPGGRVLVECWPPEWFVTTANETGTAGEFALSQSKTLHPDGELLTLDVEFRRNGTVWRHAQVVRRIADDELERSLKTAGLVLDEWITANRRWFSATGDAVR